MSTKATSTRSKKSKGSAPTETPDSDITPIGAHYQEPEVKTEDNPMVTDWFTLVFQQLSETVSVQPTSPLDPDGLLKLWNSNFSQGMFNLVLSDIMVQHPAFALDPNNTSPLTLSVVVVAILF